MTASGEITIVGACIFLFAGAISFFFNYVGGFGFVLTRDLVWLGILSLLSFMLGLIGGVLILEAAHLKWIFRILVLAVIVPILPVITDAARFPFGGYPIIFYYVDLTFLIFDLPAICLMIAALSLLFVGRREFDG